MLTGVSGSLLAPSFLERLLATDLAASRDWGQVLRPVHQWWRRAERRLGPAVSVRVVADVAAIPFFEARGYRLMHLEPYGLGFVGTLAGRRGATLALRVAAWGADAEREWRDTVRASRASGARWGVVFTGKTLRVVDATRPWSRRAIEFDLATALADETSAMALVSLIDAAGVAAGPLALDALVARSERHGVAVCAALGDGVIDALSALYAELRGAARPVLGTERHTFEQAVTLVYRLLFLLFAEARGAVPTWHPVYRQAYTVEALCRRALAAPGRRGLWATLQAISRLACHGCHAGDLVVTPFNGRLFSARHTPLAERATVPDAIIGRAVVALATTAGRGARERIDYGDLGVEQLGAVYERVLEYEPARQTDQRPLARTSPDRKATGSFYTPRSITDFLVRRALHPLVAGKTGDQILRLRVLDPAMGSGAFLVAACRYLADALERALIDEGSLAAERTPAERSAIRRLVAQRCLFGVDRNPMAVQLARLSLWLASLSADRPLTFLDHHLATGDSLIGASLADLVRAPLATRTDRARPGGLPLFELGTASDLAHLVLPQRFRLATEPDHTPGDVHAKERALASLTATGTPLACWKAMADLWCAAWFWNHAGDASPAAPASVTAGIFHDVSAALLGRPAALAASQHAAVIAHTRALAERHRFFHWELEFPEVFFTSDGERDPDGGFDAVVGNPPWEVMRADTGDGNAREHARARHRATLRFVRDARIYRRQGGGHANSYQLFVERALQLIRPGGRLALVVPSGLATDQGSALLRRALFAETTIDRIFGFDNHRALFPIHRDVRFLLLTATKGAATERVVCALGRSDARCLDQLPDAAADDPPEIRATSVTRRLLETWDPEHLTLPWLIAPDDVALLSHVSGAVAPLADAAGWAVSFGRELNATDDRELFVARRPGAPAGLLPVLDGRHLEPFRVRLADSTRAVAKARAARVVDPARTFERARLAYRDVASATNRLTLIAARLPAGTISTHTVFCSKDRLGADAQYCLLALLNSLVVNYLVRLRVTTHVTAALMGRLPVPRPASTSAVFRELASLARALEQTGIAGQNANYARVNALAAQLYGVSAAQYARVVGTFPLLPAEVRAACVSAYGGSAAPQASASDA